MRGSQEKIPVSKNDPPRAKFLLAILSATLETILVVKYYPRLGFWLVSGIIAVLASVLYWTEFRRLGLCMREQFCRFGKWVAQTAKNLVARYRFAKKKKLMSRAFWADADQLRAAQNSPYYEPAVRREMDVLRMPIDEFGRLIGISPGDAQTMIKHLEIIPHRDYLQRIAGALCVQQEHFQDPSARLNTGLIAQRLRRYFHQGRISQDTYALAINPEQDLATYAVEVIERFTLTRTSVGGEELCDAIIRARSKHNLAVRCVDEWKFQDAVHSLGQAVSILQAYCDHPEARKLQEEHSHAYNALLYLSKGWPKLGDSASGKNPIEEAACISNLGAAALPPGQAQNLKTFEDVGMYKFGCAKMLSKIVTDLRIHPPPQQSRKWVPAGTAISYLGLIGRTEKTAQKPCLGITALIDQVFGPATDFENAPYFFVCALQGAQKVYRC